MTDFVPFPTPPGSSGQGPLQLNGDTFTAGDVIKCSVTASVGAVTGTVTDTETVLAPITPTPLPTQRTFLMEDAYNGGYAQAIADNPTTATSITWVLGRGNYFPQTASNGETINLDNDLSTQAKADAWAEVWTTWALDQLAAKEAAGLTVDGNPICIDPEDMGVDSAVANVDWAYAKTSGSSITTGSYSDARVGHTGTQYTTDVSVAIPLALDAMDQVTRNVKAQYPNSPVGWYNTGFMVYLPGWRGADTDPVNGEWAHFEAVLNGLVTEDSNFYQWRALAQCDFGFTPWYQGVGNNVVNNLNDGTDNNIAGSGWMGYFNQPNDQARALYLVLKYLGPSSTEGSGATKGDKIIFGLIDQYMATDGERKNMDGGKALAVRQALSATTGGRTASVGSGTTRSATQPENWVASDLAYPDLSLLRGASTLFGTAIQNPGDSTSAGSSVSPGVYNVPYIKEEFVDYMSWMFTADSSTLPEEYGACPSDATINVAGAGTTYPDLTDTMADMRMSIFDGDMATEYSYTPSAGGTNTVETVNGRWAAGDMSTIGMQKQVTVLYSGYGVYKDYASSVPGQTAADIFPSGDKAAWYDPDKKARAVAMINRATNGFYPTNIGTVTVTGSTSPVTGTEETYTATFDGNAPDAVYSWSTTPSTSTIDVNTGTNTAGITFDADDTYTVTCTITSDSSSDSPADGTLASVVSSSSGDWPDTEIGVGSFSEFSGSDRVVTMFTAYPNGAGRKLDKVKFTGSTNFNRYPQSQYAGTGDMPNLPEYMAVWVPPVATGTSYGDNYVSGWYVFQKESPLPGSAAAVGYPTPVAWPTAGSPPAGSLALNDQGFVSLNVDVADGGTYVIQFDTLPAGASGNGGTDGWSDPPQASGIGTLIVDNGTTGSGIGGVEAPVQADAGTLTPDGQSSLGNSLQFRDSSKNGTWTQDGLGLLWDFSTSSIKSEWDSRIGTTGGTFTIVEAGTESVIFSYEWTDTPFVWTSNTWNFPMGTGAGNVGTVPSTNTRVDVYFSDGSSAPSVPSGETDTFTSFSNLGTTNAYDTDDADGSGTDHYLKSVSSAGPLWLANNTSGSTTGSLFFPSSTERDAFNGTYDLRITTPSGTSTSSAWSVVSGTQLDFTFDPTAVFALASDYSNVQVEII